MVSFVPRERPELSSSPTQSIGKMAGSPSDEPGARLMCTTAAAGRSWPGPRHCRRKAALRTVSADDTCGLASAWTCRTAAFGLRRFGIPDRGPNFPDPIPKFPVREFRELQSRPRVIAAFLRMEILKSPGQRANFPVFSLLNSEFGRETSSLET